MIVAINYANDKFKNAQKLNSKCARRHGADKVIEYSMNNLSAEFREKNKEIICNTRGDGYWIWKPYIMMLTLSEVDYGDYVIYSDSRSAFVNKIQFLIDVMNKEELDIMVFSVTHLEKCYTKRDAFILMGCDNPECVNSPQISATCFIIRKSESSVNFIDQYLTYVQDIRILTDQQNVMGKDNYEGFIDNRHDQSILSLLCKKEGVEPFRDPSEWGNDSSGFSGEINEKSVYPQIIESHRNPYIKSIFQLKYKAWYRYFDWRNHLEVIRMMIKRII